MRHRQVIAVAMLTAMGCNEGVARIIRAPDVPRGQSALLIVTVVDGLVTNVSAHEPGNEWTFKAQFTADPEALQLYAMSFDCGLTSLGFLEGDVLISEVGQALPQPRQVFVNGPGEQDWRTLAQVPPLLSELRVLVDDGLRCATFTPMDRPLRGADSPGRWLVEREPGVTLAGLRFGEVFRIEGTGEPVPFDGSPLVSAFGEYVGALARGPTSTLLVSTGGCFAEIGPNDEVEHFPCDSHIPLGGWAWLYETAQGVVFALGESGTLLEFDGVNRRRIAYDSEAEVGKKGAIISRDDEELLLIGPAEVELLFVRASGRDRRIRVSDSAFDKLTDAEFVDPFGLVVSTNNGRLLAIGPSDGVNPLANAGVPQTHHIVSFRGHAAVAGINGSYAEVLSDGTVCAAESVSDGDARSFITMGDMLLMLSDDGSNGGLKVTFLIPNEGTASCSL